MNFRSAAFWLFLLTVGGNHRQLSPGGCWGVAAEITQKAASELQQGNELENALKLRATPKQTRFIGDITTTSTDATAAKSIGHQPMRRAKATSTDQNLEHHFKQSVVQLFDSDERYESSEAAITEGGDDDGATATISAANSAEATTTHHPGRRHVVPDKLQYTKEIQVKQGRLMGITRRFQVTSGLRQVDQFLGLPYAEAPTGNRRFMPPGAPLPWQGLKIARHLPPVCPQKLPDLSPHGSATMSRGRFKHLTRLLPYLRIESEDCLYLNLYVPHEETQSTPKKYAVLVYLHGESFEWNSGNPYDGSVLASYGEVIVVTVNYRLGVLGFLRPSIDAHNIANYALLDQIAALHWIKENIDAFGGDNSRVTLMGHSTGAACVNYLMVSPVASGLFHRAILMSGSAMSDWAASNQSLQLTMQIAHALDCPLHEHVEAEDDDVLLDCLRHRRYQDILHIPTALTQFSTSLGPIVDGHVIPNQPYKVMGHYTEHFSRYDLLFGITESESYHTLAALALAEGLRENERDNLLRFYMQSRFDVRPDLALAATLKKYQDMYNNPIKATNLEHRDVVLDILSDARVVGPLLQTGTFHADVNRRNYMYVFGHNSATGPYAHLPHSIMGEELAFIFGAPLAPAGPFPSNNYTVQEKLLSEAVMAYWTNFAKTGNPKAPWKGTFLNSHALEWDRYDLDWPEFNRRSQAYLNIGIPPTVGFKYRQIYMNFWNKELPDEINQIAAIQEQLHGPSHEVITGHMSKYGPRDHDSEDPVRVLKQLLQEPTLAGPESTETAAENMYNAPPTFGHIHKIQGGSDFELITPPSSFDNGDDQQRSESPETVAKSEITLQLLIALIAIIIALNVIIYGTFWLRQRRRRSKALPFPGPKLGGHILSYDGANDEELKRCSKSRDGDDSFVLEVTRKSNTYEAIKTGQRSLSCSTVDTHTKVCEWMSGQEAPKAGSFATATPPPHQPILADGRLIICQDIEVADAALLIPQHMHEPQHYEMLLQRQHSALTEPSEDVLQPQYPTRSHAHSHSDPVDMILAADEQVTSFVHADDVDINVTSRDDPGVLEIIPLTAAQQLELLRQRNYPKVLPTEQDFLDTSYKRNSLPPQNYNAPQPPPRTISSTLGRRRRDSSNVTTSPLQLAQDISADDEDNLREPQITQNTLIVGPIVPKSPATSLKRRKDKEPAAAAMTALSGSFQSFESVPPAHETTPPQGERTECIYAIQASPASPTTPVSPGSSSWSAPNGDLYAQPVKSPSRTSLIPRPTHSLQVATSQAPQTGDGVPGAIPSRIPQLHRQASGKDLQATLQAAFTENTANPSGCQQRTDSTISSGSSASNDSSTSSSTGSSSSSSTGTVRTELQQFQPLPGRSITTNI
ncbi:uncharacterized protein Dana_GF17679, isoform D [Drosophila ananassae]|uniref:Uncharacterized protein, isoform A n=3 Tax=Drosophila ananassae TaxID=7217 RepID=B3LYX9_DROAN|nr:uncharacterized protein LOC6500462 isoform X1 [Drosophila ananassae]XP_014766570.1 uncharacterized protein LOC6500462 isoform X1 [Drosophila ananassae]XP_014766571.1 uncharacterized protein LOC6500462 isoform X1 [Drosophila ananassae]EDV41853.1 uncharacterized protein Dana_GF17679, isoform A [Drosophila ananassae]KPU79389.1 uncharacterized protein Dana_GF17679, isoform C [Drosophila ananassae]KPU79390.1 uncharacterized protein Dana_GF17679, isoform D [Drosophila ananassae]